jgi:hypothetical protein
VKKNEIRKEMMVQMTPAQAKERRVNTGAGAKRAWGWEIPIG